MGLLQLDLMCESYMGLRIETQTHDSHMPLLKETKKGCWFGLFDSGWLSLA